VQWLGFPEAAVPFETAPRFAGKSRYTVGRLVRLAFDGLFSFSRVPLRLAIGAGLIAITASFVICAGLVMKYGTSPVTAGVLLAVHVVGASVLAAVGVLGAYVVRVYEESKRRPLYVLKEAWPAALAISAQPLPHRSAPAAARSDATAA
jgi:dolichol-phosphate mannosyltransferase